LRKRPPSGYYGVTRNRNRWHAQITTDGKQHNLGTFATKEEAALVYDRSVRQCTEHKPLNFDTLVQAEHAAVEAKAKFIHMSRASQPNRQRPTSGFCGVKASGKGWKAKITINNQNHYLGRFELKEEAALAYDRAVMQLREPRALNYHSAEIGEQAVLLARAQRKKQMLERQWQGQLRQHQHQHQHALQQQPLPQQPLPQHEMHLIQLMQPIGSQQVIVPAVLKGLEKPDIADIKAGRNEMDKPKEPTEPELTRLLIDHLQQQLQELNQGKEEEPVEPLLPLDQLERRLQELRKQQHQLLSEQR
jgi:hypothetical protein